MLAAGFWAIGLGPSTPVEDRTTVPGAEDAVRAFFAALGEKDVETAFGLLAADRSYVVLPGLSDPIGPDDPAGPALGFFAGVAATEVGECDEVRSLRTDAAGSVVRCSLVVISDYRADLGLDDSIGIVSAVVIGGVLRSVMATVDDRRPPFELYCVWARDVDPTTATAAFDDRCRPVETAETAPVHLRLAAAFAETTPTQDPSPLTVVDAFARIHNAGGAPIQLFEEPFRVVTFPGVPVADPRWPFPELEDYLEWSSTVYDLDLGPCVVEPRSGLTAVICDDAMLAGPLPRGLGLGPVDLPIQFYVRGGRIAGISGRSPAVLTSAFADLCEESGSAATFLKGGCTPRYDAVSAKALLGTLG
ncbi:MAG: hypothetical protein EHM57_01440 [Actinobacteria bacterium]|nr:MAG: hypothetical protein EHM57_01440 [Actinomycetota bacterium]